MKSRARARKQEHAPRWCQNEDSLGVVGRGCLSILERDTRFELATPALARQCSTTELVPQRRGIIRITQGGVKSPLQVKPKGKEAHASPHPSIRAISVVISKS